MLSKDYNMLSDEGMGGYSSKASPRGGLGNGKNLKPNLIPPLP